MHTPFSRRTRLALVTASLCILSMQASAQYSATASIGSLVIGQTTTPGDVTYTSNPSGPAGTTSLAAVSFTASPVASIGVVASGGSSIGQLVAGAAGRMTYSFQVLAQPFSMVPIDFSGLYASYAYSSTANGNNSEATSRFVVEQTNTNIAHYELFSSYFFGDCGNPGCVQYSNTTSGVTYTSVRPDATHLSGIFQGSVDMLTDATGKIAGTVLLDASAGTEVFFNTGSASSFIDPHLEIDANYVALHPDARLTITAGVGNQIAGAVTPVPEPSTYAMMFAGLVIVGVASRRQKRPQY